MTDAERQAWNDALARGDQAEIEQMQHDLLTAVHTRIMNDDEVYIIGGWKPT